MKKLEMSSSITIRFFPLLSGAEPRGGREQFMVDFVCMGRVWVWVWAWHGRPGGDRPAGGDEWKELWHRNCQATLVGTQN